MSAQHLQTQYILQNPQFARKFKDFIKPYTCETHKQHPTFVCIDSNCQKRGLICSLCLTINGNHKNHDSVEIHEFLSHCIKSYQSNNGKSGKNSQMDELVKQINEAYEDLLKVLTNFHQSFSSLIKSYIAKKSDNHREKQQYLVTENSLEMFKACKFRNLEEMNSTLEILITRVATSLKIDQISEQKLISETQYYLDDLTYEISYISDTLKKTEDKFRDIFLIKNTSPSVITVEPTFLDPKCIENQNLLYIGECNKNSKPHGKGISYHKNSQKIIYGNFKNGQLEGQGELYFSAGDHYIGEFKFDKKEGRGAYYWTGKQNNVYEGQFKSGKRHGRGTFWWSDGSWYQGRFREGMQEGFGILYRANQEKQYQGQWLDGMFHGQGKQFFQNGQKYEGNFKQDKFHGDGVFYKDDSIIYGVWKDNELSVVNMVKSTLEKQK